MNKMKKACARYRSSRARAPLCLEAQSYERSFRTVQALKAERSEAMGCCSSSTASKATDLFSNTHRTATAKETRLLNELRSLPREGLVVLLKQLPRDAPPQPRDRRRRRRGRARLADRRRDSVGRRERGFG